MSVSSKALYILGTRGVPAAHGGFETFAQRFALYMRDRGWSVTVYCQADEGSKDPVIDDWQGIRRVTIAADAGAGGTMKFDWACVRHAMKERGVMLVLGYNTAIFSALLRFTENPVLTNMDGIEWKRAKWPWHGRIWLYLNEWIGALTSNMLIADHPEIAKHLQRRRARRYITMIPYGADAVTEAPVEYVTSQGLTPGKYVISIGRIEPENNILPMIQGFVARPNGMKFLCLGRLEPDTNPYHAQVIAAARGNDDVIFAGAIYDSERVKALRFHAAAYCHGHSVGGTNPSLVESLGAGNAVIGHDNAYNRWVAGPDQFYFADEAGFAAVLDKIGSDPDALRLARQGARARFENGLTWPPVLEAYEAVCEQSLAASKLGETSR
jgi:glycosyltransferase involved in cell wall biosynthesis